MNKAVSSGFSDVTLTDSLIPRADATQCLPNPPAETDAPALRAISAGVCWPSSCAG